MHEPAVLEGEHVEIKKGDLTGAKLKAKYVSEDQLGGVFNKSKVEFVNISPGISESHVIKAVVKEALSARRDFLLGEESFDQSGAQRYYERWRYLKKLGIPVVSSMRVVDSKRILMGNMTADGSEFIGKESYWEGGKKGVPLTELENKFLQIDDYLLKQEIERVQKIAWDNGIILPDDDEEFAVLVHPNGSWKVIVRDLGWLDLKKNWNGHDFEKTKAILFKRVDKIRSTFKERQKLK